MVHTKVDDLRNMQLVLRCSLIQRHLSAASVNRDIHHRIVELSLELSFAERDCERMVGAIFALPRVMWPGIVVAKSSALVVREGIMLLSALNKSSQARESQPLALVLRTRLHLTLKLRPTILQQLARCGLIQVNMCFCRLRRYCLLYTSPSPRDRG